MVDLTNANATGWIRVTFCYRTATKELELFIDGKLERLEPCNVVPVVDREMPVWLGGANATDQRFQGKIRGLWLSNIP